MQIASFTKQPLRVPVLSKCLGLLLLLGLSMPAHTDTPTTKTSSNTESKAQAQAQPRPPWLQEDVLRAAFAINMSKEQLPQYRTALTNLVQGYQRSMNRLLQRNNVSDLKQKMKSATNRQFSRFDKAMFKFLEDGQREPYGVYRELLKDRLINTARSGAATDPRKSGQINADIDGFSNSG